MQPWTIVDVEESETQARNHAEYLRSNLEEHSVGVFGPPTSKFVFTCLVRMVCSEDTRVYPGSGGTYLRPVRCCSCYRHLVCSRGYKQAREGKDPKSLVEGVNGC